MALVKVAANAANRIWRLLKIWLFLQMATILGLVGPAGLVFIPTVSPELNRVRSSTPFNLCPTQTMG